MKSTEAYRATCRNKLWGDIEQGRLKYVRIKTQTNPLVEREADADGQTGQPGHFRATAVHARMPKSV